VGYVTRDVLAAHMPAASLGSDALVMVCGPPGEGTQAGQAGIAGRHRSQGLWQQHAGRLDAASRHKH
jgi:hypothetical protein